MNIKNMKILMMGIGGIGVSALARLYKNRGAHVYGCDKKETPLLNKLKTDGINIINERDINVRDYDQIIYTNAIRKTNPVMKEALKYKIPLFKRGEILAGLLSLSKGVAITGSHGKTTTTFMTAHLFRNAGLSPSVYGGGIDNHYKTNYIKGVSKWLIAELDESDRTFVEARPLITIITNWEHEHVDEYKTFKSQNLALKKFFTNAKKNSVLIINGDDNKLRELGLKYFGGKKVVTCGKNQNNDFVISRMTALREGTVIEISAGKHNYTFKTNTFGEHNAYDFTLSYAAAREAGISEEIINKGIKKFKGVERRFEIIKNLTCGGLLISDYGHHPTEIKAVLSTARIKFKGKRIIAVFEPHRCSRLKKFFVRFAAALNLSDYVILADVYTAGEEGDTEALLRELKQKFSVSKCRYMKTENIIGFIEKNYISGEIVIVFSAGRLDLLAREAAERQKILI